MTSQFMGNPVSADARPFLERAVAIQTNDELPITNVWHLLEALSSSPEVIAIMSDCGLDSEAFSDAIAKGKLRLRDQPSRFPLSEVVTASSSVANSSGHGSITPIDLLVAAIDAASGVIPNQPITPAGVRAAIGQRELTATFGNADDTEHDVAGTLTILAGPEEIAEANDLINQIEDGIHFLRDIDETPERVKGFFDDFTLPDLETLRRLVGADDLTANQVTDAKSEAGSRLAGVANTVSVSARWIGDVGPRALQAVNAAQRLGEIFGGNPPTE